jgi:hypothetical protein
MLRRGHRAVATLVPPRHEAGRGACSELPRIPLRQYRFKDHDAIDLSQARDAEPQQQPRATHATGNKPTSSSLLLTIVVGGYGGGTAPRRRCGGGQRGTAVVPPPSRC